MGLWRPGRDGAGEPRQGGAAWTLRRRLYGPLLAVCLPQPPAEMRAASLRSDPAMAGAPEDPVFHVRLQPWTRHPLWPPLRHWLRQGEGRALHGKLRTHQWRSAIQPADQGRIVDEARKRWRAAGCLACWRGAVTTRHVKSVGAGREQPCSSAVPLRHARTRGDGQEHVGQMVKRSPCGDPFRRMRPAWHGRSGKPSP